MERSTMFGPAHFLNPVSGIAHERNSNGIGQNGIGQDALVRSPMIETYYWLAGGTDDLPLYVGAVVRLFTKGDDGDPDAVPSAELEAIVQPDAQNVSGPQFLTEREVLFFPGGADALLAWRNGDTSRRDNYLSGTRALMAAQWALELA